MNTDIPSRAQQLPGQGHLAVALAECLRGLLVGLHDPQVDRFLAAWPARLIGRVTYPLRVPVARWLGELSVRAPDFAAEFVARLAGAEQHLAWRQSYRSGQAAADFLDRYGYCELLGEQAPVASARLAAGVLLLGPHTDYPAHWHEAEEIYVPLLGTARWWQGIQGWGLRAPGSVIRHERFEPHAMRTADQPLLAAYLWQSGDLAQKSQLISRPSG